MIRDIREAAVEAVALIDQFGSDNAPDAALFLPLLASDLERQANRMKAKALELRANAGAGMVRS
jgi:hypothetical protein